MTNDNLTVAIATQVCEATHSNLHQVQPDQALQAFQVHLWYPVCVGGWGFMCAYICGCVSMFHRTSYGPHIEQTNKSS